MFFVVFFGGRTVLMEWLVGVVAAAMGGLAVGSRVVIPLSLSRPVVCCFFRVAYSHCVAVFA